MISVIRLMGGYTYRRYETVHRIRRLLARTWTATNDDHQRLSFKPWEFGPHSFERYEMSIDPDLRTFKQSWSRLLDVLVTSRQKTISILQFCTNMKRFGKAQGYEENLAHYAHHNMVSLTFSGHENSIPTLRALGILLLRALLKCTLKNKAT